MAQNSNIEWTDHTVNLWWGCEKEHTGCKNCYAEYLSEKRCQNGVWGKNAPRKRIKSAFKDLHKFQAIAEKAGEKHRVFIGSMMDIFEDSKKLNNPVIDIEAIKYTGQIRSSLFSMIDGGMFPNLIFLFLTKRPHNINAMIPDSWKRIGAPANVWFGTSVSNAETMAYASRLFICAPKNANLFISIEPQVGMIGEELSVDLFDWIIQGGESGHKKRPFNIEWAESMRDQCAAAGVPYFFKQIDKVQQIPEALQIRQFPKF